MLLTCQCLRIRLARCIGLYEFDTFCYTLHAVTMATNEILHHLQNCHSVQRLLLPMPTLYLMDLISFSLIRTVVVIRKSSCCSVDKNTL